MDLQIANFLHDAGIALGVGGVTFLYIIEVLAKKTDSLKLLVKKIAPVFGKFIVIGLLLLIGSGIWLNQLVTWPMDQTMLTVKYVTIAVLILNSIYLKLFTRKKLMTAKPATEEYDSVKKTVMTFSTIGLILWWAVMVESVLL